MNLINGNPEFLSVAWIPSNIPEKFPPHICGLTETFIVKGTFKLVHGSTARAHPDGAVSPRGDLPFTGSDQFEIRYGSDFVPIKPHGEFLLVGTGHSPQGMARQSFPISFRAGSLQKKIQAIGPRVWKEGLLQSAPGKPSPLSRVDLRYSNAWGGVNYRLNPLGCGKDTTHLPLLEQLNTPVEHRDSRVMPAGFGPIPSDWEQRACKVGTYGKNWLAERWPWLPDDFDYTYFNAAPPSQWLSGYWRGDEELAFENIHPTEPHYTSRLPCLQVRFFVSRFKETFCKSPAPLEELRMNLDTLWVDMDTETLVLVWRGRCAVKTVKLHDIENLLFFSEPLNTPFRSEGEYQAMIQNFLNPSATEIQIPKLDPNAIPLELAKIQKRMHELKAQVYKDATQALQDYAAQEKAAKASRPAAMASSLSDFQKSLKESGIEVPTALPTSGPLADLFKKHEPPKPDVPSPEEVEALVAAKLAEGRKKHQALMDLFPKKLTKEDFLREGKLNVLKLLREGAPAVDMSGVDFSGLDLSGVNFSGARLVDAKFIGTKLFGANFTQANLTGADLSGSVLTLANFKEADLANCQIKGATWGKVFLDGAQLAGLNFDGADLSYATGQQTNFSGSSFRGAQMVNAAFVCGDFSRACLDDANLSGAQLFYADFRKCFARRVNFTGAQLGHLRAGDAANFSDSTFHQVSANNSVWEKSLLEKADFLQAHLEGSRFCDAQLFQASFNRAHLQGSTFEDAKITHADMSHANLLRVVFDRADLSESTMNGSNLFESSFWETQLYKTTWDNAFIKQTKLDIPA
jgi:uncharacterized protein YjbI with pentapeptide repeats